MSTLVSIIIPAYNGASYLGEAIQSVLDQTYPYWELIVVDDVSKDHTADVVVRFNDPRIRFIRHAQNRGSDVARKTGLDASSGEIVIFLDQDDVFHPEKLKAHVAFLDRYVEFGITYNPRFVIFDASQVIRELYVPPAEMTLADLVSGFPVSPSDVVMRRPWALQMDLMGGSLSWCGGEIVHYGGLFLAGCRFACINRVLNYRRYYTGRVFKDLEGGCKAELYAKDKILNDPRCPQDVAALRDAAYTNSYVIWAFYALAQNETALGQRFLQEAIRLTPSLLSGKPCKLADFIASASAFDDGQDHTVLMKKIFAQLPPELVELQRQSAWAVARGYLLKGARAILWQRPEEGRNYFECAAQCAARIDRSFLRQLVQDLLNYEAEFGRPATSRVLQDLMPFVRRLGGESSLHWLKGCYSVNRGFHDYKANQYSEVPVAVLSAVTNDPRYLLNRGVLSMFFRSTAGLMQNRFQAQSHIAKGANE